MQRRVGTFVPHYGKVLGGAVLIIMLMLAGSSAVFAQESAGLPGPGPSEGCANPSQIVTFSGSEARRTEPFSVPNGTDVLRIRYFIDPTNQFGGDLSVDVFDDEGLAGGFTTDLATEPSGGSENIILFKSGSHHLEIDPFDVTYQIAVDACGGDLETTTGTTTDATRVTTMGTTTAADDQYGDTTDDTTTGDGADQENQSGIPSEKKIIDVPKQKVLVDTGGPPWHLLGAALMCLAGAGIAGQLLRVLRR